MKRLISKSPVLLGVMGIHYWRDTKHECWNGVSKSIISLGGMKAVKSLGQMKPNSTLHKSIQTIREIVNETIKT